MTNSQGKWLSWEWNRRSLKKIAAVSGLISLLAISPLPGYAQDSNTPLRLAPPVTLEPPKAEDPVDREPKLVDPASVEKVGEGIQTDTLSDIDPDSTGIMTKEEGGYGLGMWSGTSRRLAMRLLSQLPADTTSPALRSMLRRLLLSTATPPERGDDDTDSASLLTKRVERLSDMGDLVGVADLLKVIPGHKTDQDLVRIEADTLFVSNDLARACALVSNNLGEQENPFWQQAFAFCQALAGEHDKAALAAELMRESEIGEPVFFELLDALAGNGKPELKNMASPKPLYLAMARAAKVKLPTTAAWSTNPAVLRAIAISPYLSVEERVDAAEQAEAVGALRTENLRKIYAGVPFKKEELTSALSQADKIRGAMGRALLYRSALAQEIPTAIAEVVQMALVLAQEGGRYDSGVRVFLPILRQLEARDELLWFAPDAIRAFLAVGDVEAADSWFRLVRAGAIFKAEVKEIYNELMPLARVAGNREAESWGAEQLREWWEKRRDSAEERDKALMLLVLLEAFGEIIDEKLWQELLVGPQKVAGVLQRPSLWFTLKAASSNIRVAETVALTAIGLGQGGAANMEPMFLRHVLDSLIRVGLRKDARALALEAAIASGL